MGGASSSSQAWNSYKTTTRIDSSTTKQIYTSSRLKDVFNPVKFEFRESRDNQYQPETTPIIVGLDVTGSMSSLLKTVASGIGTFASTIFEKDIVKDPQIMMMGIGDVKCDNAPLQVTQFESDIKILEQLKELYFEEGGGGNGSESYPLGWYYASKYTLTDALEKRDKKGIMITIGNDGLPESLLNSEILRFVGKNDETISTKNIYSMVSKKYETFHIHLTSGMGGWNNGVEDSLREVLGDNLIIVNDVETIPEVMIALCMKLKGMDESKIENLLGNNPKAKQIASSVKSVAVVSDAKKTKQVVEF